MNPFEVKNSAVIVVNGDQLHFVLIDRPGEWSILPDFCSIERIIDNPHDVGFVPETVRHRILTLIIVPDYWLGNMSHVFQSKKRSLAQVFIERKLLSEYPDLNGIQNFYKYDFYQTHQKERGVFIRFLKEPRAYQLYHRLVELDLTPYEITTPALLWEQLLRNGYSDFGKGGKALVHLLPTLAFIYFYSFGHFLFSRQIILPETGGDLSGIFSFLDYEISQSLYLFSQQAKSEIDQFFLFSSVPEQADTVSTGLARETVIISDKIGIQHPLTEPVQDLGPVSPFSTFSPNSFKGFQSVSHRLLKKTREWRPVQTVGIVVGLILLFLLGGETIFLKKLHQDSQFELTGALNQSESSQAGNLEAYNEALDFMLSVQNRVSVEHVLVRLSACFPDNIRIANLEVVADPDPHVALDGIVRAAGPSEFKEVLSGFLDRLKSNFPGSRSLRFQEIEMGKGNEKTATGDQIFLFNLKFGLP